MPVDKEVKKTDPKEYWRQVLVAAETMTVAEFKTSFPKEWILTGDKIQKIMQ
jgi:hypothetical protein